MSIEIVHGDAGRVLRRLDADSIDAICTDPPAGIGMMGKDWDHDKGGRRQWIAWLASIMAEGLRVLRAGGYAFVWALPRTSHWTATALEDAGFEIRDDLHEALSGCDLYRQFIDSLSGEQRTAWARVLEALGPSRVRHLFGSGFPKSKALLKPAVEDWILCRKPGPLRHLRIDGCRVGMGKRVPGGLSRTAGFSLSGSMDGTLRRETGDEGGHNPNVGRWPANFVLSHSENCERVGTKRIRGDARQGGEGMRPGGFADVGADKGSDKPCGPLYGDAEVPAYRCAEGQEIQCYRCGAWQTWDGEEAEGKCEACRERFEQTTEMCQMRKMPLCPVALLDAQSGQLRARGNKGASKGGGGLYGHRPCLNNFGAGDAGTASRFFHCFDPDPFIYQAKASRKDRGEGNTHTTVKSTHLMRHLIRLIAAPGDTVLDMFAGSGSTGVACQMEGLHFIGIEQDAESVKTARRRLAAAQPRPLLAEQSEGP